MLVLSIIPVTIKNRDGEHPADYCLTYGGKTVVMEETAIPAAIVPIIDILNEIIGDSAPYDVIPRSPNFSIILFD